MQRVVAPTGVRSLLLAEPPVLVVVVLAKLGARVDASAHTLKPLGK